MAFTAEALQGIFLPNIVKKRTMDIPYFGILQDMIPMSDADRIGEKFVIPVTLQLEQGATYKASNSGAYTREVHVDGKVLQAECVGSQIDMRSVISTEAIVSSQDEKRAVEQALDVSAKLNSISHKKRLEIALLYGQSHKAVVESIAGAVVKFTAASFAPAMWAGMKGAKVEFFDPTYATRRAVVVTDEYATIGKVSTRTREITLDYYANIVAGDVIQFKGAVVAGGTPAWNEMAGLKKIFSNTTGLLFGINSSTYDVWEGNPIDAEQAWLSYLLMNAARSMCLDKGGEDPDYKCMCSNWQFTLLQQNEAAGRMYDSSYSKEKATTGSNKLLYASAGGGTIEPIPHPFMWPSDAFLFTKELLRRPGAQDFSFNLTGGKGEARWSPEGRYITDLTDTAGHQIRSYSHGCIFYDSPGHAAIITNLKPFDPLA
jgi:hypothetical protein